MSKRTFREVRKAILKVLSDGKEHSYGDIERRVNTNWKTVRDHIQDLKLFDLVKLEKNKMSITKKGKLFLQKL